MKFFEAVKETKKILDPTYNGDDKSPAILKGKKDHNDEMVDTNKNAKGQKPAGK